MKITGPRPRAHLDVLRGAPEPHDEDAHAPLHAVGQWILKKVENHKASVALYFMFYNFGRIHKTLRVTPAMEAGVSNHVWSLEEIAGLTG